MYNSELAKNPKTLYKKRTMILLKESKYIWRSGILKESSLQKMGAIEAKLYCHNNKELVELGILYKK